MVLKSLERDYKYYYYMIRGIDYEPIENQHPKSGAAYSGTVV